MFCYMYAALSLALLHTAADSFSVPYNTEKISFKTTPRGVLKEQKQQRHVPSFCMSMSAPTSSSKRRNRSVLSMTETKNHHTASQERRQRSLRRGNMPLLSLNLNLDSLAKSTTKGAATRAQELLQRIEALHKEGYYAAAPDAVSYNSVLNAWAKSTDDKAADKAMALLNSMVQHVKDKNGPDNDDDNKNKFEMTPSLVEPDVVSYNTVIFAFANSGQPQHAESLLRQMQQDTNIQPDTITYNTVIYAWAQQSQHKSNAPQKAEALLREMMELHHDGNHKVKPDTFSFNTVLHAWAKSRSPHSAQRAQELLLHMIHLSNAGNEDVVPDVYSYSSVICAWASSQSPSAPRRAMELLETMQQQSQEPGQEHLAPNAISYTSVMTVLAKNGKAQEAQDLLDRVLKMYEETGDEYMKPDAVSFSAVIDGWAQSKAPDASEKALALLEQMKQLAFLNGDDDFLPNARTYTSALTALSKNPNRDSVEKAEELVFYEMEELGVIPTTFCYNALLNCYAKSHSIHKATKAQDLLQRMRDVGGTKAQPDIITFNTVLLACANAIGDGTIKRTAFEIALQTFREILKKDDDTSRIKPASATFFAFFKCIRRLVPQCEIRTKLTRQVFASCCSLGLLSDAVWKQVQSASTAEELKSLIKVGATAESELCKEDPTRIRIRDFPREWTRNCKRYR